MVARTAAGSAKADRDGSGTPYEAERNQWAFEGQRAFVLIVLGFLILGFILSKIAHWAAFKVFAGLADVVNYWITFPAFGVAFWGMGILYVLSKGRLWVNVPENHSQIVIDKFPGRPNRMIKFPGGFWLIPFWWSVLERNLTDHEDQTIDLPEQEYPAKDGEGGAVVTGSFTYYVPFEEAKGYIGQNKSVIQKRLVDHVKGEIGPVIADHDATQIAGKSSMVTKKVTDTFLGTGVNPTEDDCHVRIREVTISRVALDEKTKAELEKNQAAEAQAKRMEKLMKVIDKKDGTTEKDHITRADRMRLAGIDPGREIGEKKTVIEHRADKNMIKVAEGVGAGFAQGLAMLAKIVDGVNELKGGKPEKEGK